MESLQKFGDEQKCDMLVLMGLKELESGDVRRDIGLMVLRDSDVGKQIQNEVCITNREYLQLEEKCSDIFGSVQGLLFEQKNIRASRKQIMPIIQTVLDSQ